MWRKACRSAVEIALEHPHQRRLDRDAAVFAALAADVDDGAVVGAAEVTDVGAHQFLGAQPSQEAGEDQGAVAFDPVVASPRPRVGMRAPSRAATASAGSALGSVLASLGRPTIGIGLAAIGYRGSCTTRSTSTSTAESTPPHGFAHTARTRCAGCR